MRAQAPAAAAPLPLGCGRWVSPAATPAPNQTRTGACALASGFTRLKQRTPIRRPLTSQNHETLA